MNEYNYIVWVGGTEMGQYNKEYEADEVAEEWYNDGYTDIIIEEIEVDSETPAETNEWLRAGGY